MYIYTHNISKTVNAIDTPSKDLFSITFYENGKRTFLSLFESLLVFTRFYDR